MIHTQWCRNRGGGGHCTAPPPIFSISVNPIPTGGGQIIPTYYYWPPKFFSSSGITAAVILLLQMWNCNANLITVWYSYCLKGTWYLRMAVVHRKNLSWPEPRRQRRIYIMAQMKAITMDSFYRISYPEGIFNFMIHYRGPFTVRWQALCGYFCAS